MRRGVLVLACENNGNAFLEAATFLADREAEIENSICKVRGGRTTLHLEFNVRDENNARINNDYAEFAASVGGVCELNNIVEFDVPLLRGNVYCFVVKSEQGFGVVAAVMNVLSELGVKVIAHRGATLAYDDDKFKQVFYVKTPPQFPCGDCFNDDAVNRRLQEALQPFNGHVLRGLHQVKSWLDD